MKKRIFVIIACLAMVFATFGYIGIDNTTVKIAEATEVTEASEAAELPLYDQLMAETTVAGMYTVMTEASKDEQNALTKDEINAIFDRIDELDPDCVEAKTDLLVNILVELPGFVSGAEEDGEEAVEYGTWADDMTIKKSQSIDTAYTISNNDNGGEANWTFNGNYTLTINKTVTIPKGQSLDILIGSNNSSKKATIKAGSSLGNKPMFIVEGTLKIAKTVGNSNQNHGSITIDGGIIDINGGKVQMQDIEAVNGEATWKLADGEKLQLFGDIPISGNLSIIREAAEGAADSVVAAKRTTEGFLFIVNNGGSLTTNNVTIDAGSESGYTNKMIRVKTQETADDGFELSATSTTFRNASCGDDCIFEIRSKADVEFNGGTINNCKITDKDEGVIYIITDVDGSTNTTYRKFNMTGTTVSNCASLKDSASGGVIRTNGGTYVNMNLSGCTFNNNYSGGWGVILWNAIGKCTVDHCTFNNNESDKRGGAISSEGQNIEITNSAFNNNKAGDFGGAICLFPYRLTAKDAESTDPVIRMDVTIGNGCVFNGNQATKGGAVAILVTSSTSEKATNLVAAIDLKDGYMVNNSTTNVNETGTSEGEGGGAIYAGCTEKNKDEAGVLHKSSRIELNINSGAIYDNRTSGHDGGAILVDDLRVAGGATDVATNLVTVNGGTIGREGEANTAVNGGAIAIKAGDFIMTGGTISNNTASNDGGAVYVTGGNVTMNGGSMSSNTATKNGGAVYVAGGDFNMTGGTLGSSEDAGNEASNGGAVYISGGNMNIYHGSLDYNAAYMGGAVYMNGGNLTMESGTMIDNSAIDNPDTDAVEGDGGAIYATSGKIEIGIEGCKGSSDDQKMHTDICEGRYHPRITSNVATDTGGGISIADKGEIYFYCGMANTNSTSDAGVGQNVFMNGGDFYLYDGANIGVPRDPDMVIVGGTLHNQCVEKEFVRLEYYQSNSDPVTTMVGLAEYGEIINMPDGTYFWDAPEGYVFLGWTGQGSASGQNNEYVRNKRQYVASDQPIEVLDAESTYEEIDQTYINTNIIFDGVTDEGQKIMHLYALWAPETSEITYVNGLTNNVINNTDTDPDNPATYSISSTLNNLEIQPPKQAGYKLEGWYIYQDEDQNANWSYYADISDSSSFVSYESAYKDGTLHKTYANLNLEKLQYVEAGDNGVTSLQIAAMTFGDITLIADYQPAYGDLKITKRGSNLLDSDQSYIFTVFGEPDDENLDDISMTVVIEGDKSTTIKNLPVGKYTVTEATDWSWRYTPDQKNLEVKIEGPEKTPEVTFKNNREKKYWLNGNAYKLNLFAQ